MIIGNVFCDAAGCSAMLTWSAGDLTDTYGELVDLIRSMGWGVVAAVPMSASRVKCPACVDRGASLAAALLTLLRS